MNVNNINPLHVTLPFVACDRSHWQRAKQAGIAGSSSNPGNHTRGNGNRCFVIALSSIQTEQFAVQSHQLIMHL